MNILDNIQGKLSVQGIVRMRDKKLVIWVQDGEYKPVNFDCDIVCYLRYADEMDFSPKNKGCNPIYNATSKYMLVCLQRTEKYTEKSIIDCMTNQINTAGGIYTKIVTNPEIIKAEEKIEKSFFIAVKIYFNYEYLHAPANCPELVCVC